MTNEILRYVAFPATPEGGNPAGIVLNADALTPERRQALAAEIGYPETAFITDLDPQARTATLTYFSAEAPVPFCGHATIATAVCLAERFGAGSFTFLTPTGKIEVATRLDDGQLVAAFTSVEPRVSDLDPAVLAELLQVLGLAKTDLHPGYPPRQAFAGNNHPVLVLASVARFDSFGFDPLVLRALMRREGWEGTVIVLWPERPDHFQARNLFPAGNYTEDPATGSAAAATGAYLRAGGLINPPVTFTIAQGHHIGRPCILQISVPTAGGITVAGTATPITV